MATETQEALRPVFEHLHNEGVIGGPIEWVKRGDQWEAEEGEFNPYLIAAKFEEALHLAPGVIFDAEWFSCDTCWVRDLESNKRLMSDLKEIVDNHPNQNVGFAVGIVLAALKAMDQAQS